MDCEVIVVKKDRENKHYKEYLKSVIQKEKEKEYNKPNVELDLPENIRVIHGEELNGNDG